MKEWKLTDESLHATGQQFVASPMSSLSPVPNSVVDESGAPRFGTYRGELPAVQFRQLAGTYRPARWQWLARHKRWQYSILVTDDLLCCQAVVDGNYFANGFFYAVDLFEKRKIFSKSLIAIPGLQVHVNDHPALGHLAHLQAPGVSFSTSREGYGDDGYLWKASVKPARSFLPGGISLEGQIKIGDRPPALTVVSPVEGGIINVTQKWAALPATGHARFGSRTYDLEKGLVGLDYSQGILGRRTVWKWAMALGRLSDGRSVGVNLVSGFNDDRPDSNENALWIGDEMIPLSRATFQLDRKNPQNPWFVETRDGRLKLRFDPYYVHTEMRNLGVINSFFLQPAGRFEGVLTLDGKEHSLILHGVMEDQDVRW